MAGSTNLKDLVLDGITDSLRPGGKDYVEPEKVKPSMKKISKGKGTVFTEKAISTHMKKYGLPRGVAIKALGKKKLKNMNMQEYNKARAKGQVK